MVNCWLKSSILPPHHVAELKQLTTKYDKKVNVDQEVDVVNLIQRMVDVSVGEAKQIAQQWTISDTDLPVAA